MELANISFTPEYVTDQVTETVIGRDGRARTKTVAFKYRGKLVHISPEIPLRAAVDDLGRQDRMLKVLIGCGRIFEELGDLYDSVLWYEYTLDQTWELRDAILGIAKILRIGLQTQLMAQASPFPELNSARERTLMILNSTLEATDTLKDVTLAESRDEISRLKLALARARGLLDFFLNESFADLLRTDPREDLLAQNELLDARWQRQKLDSKLLFDSLVPLRTKCREYRPRAKALLKLGKQLKLAERGERGPVAGAEIEAIADHLEELEPIITYTRGMMRSSAVRLEEIVKFSEEMDLLTEHCEKTQMLCANMGVGQPITTKDYRRLVKQIRRVITIYQDLAGAVDAWLNSVADRKYLAGSVRLRKTDLKPDDPPTWAGRVHDPPSQWDQTPTG